MKRFKFRLVSLLKLRQQAEDEKKRVVGELLSEIHAQQREALEMDGRLQEEGELLKQQHLQGVIDLDWVGHYRRYVTHVQEAINQRISNVIKVQGKLSQARSELAEASKQKKILEKLKEKKQQRYQKQLQRQDVRDSDEIAAQLYLRAGY